MKIKVTLCSVDEDPVIHQSFHPLSAAAYRMQGHAEGGGGENMIKPQARILCLGSH